MICEHCGCAIAVRNPSGYCDHLYYPECCKICKSRLRLRLHHFGTWFRFGLFHKLELAQYYLGRNERRLWTLSLPISHWFSGHLFFYALYRYSPRYRYLHDATKPREWWRIR